MADDLNAGVPTVGFGTSTTGTQYGTGAGTGTANNWSWLAPLLSGVGSLVTAPGDMSAARQAAGTADPFSGERGQYMTGLRNFMGANPVDPSKVTGGTNDALSQLMHFMQDPSSIRGNPAYQAGLGFGTDAVNRGAGASGMLNSGNRGLALQKFGQDYGMGFENQIYNQLLGDVGANVNAANLGLNAQHQGYSQLAQLSGANIGSPAAAAQALMQGRQNQANSVGAGFGGIANAAPGAISAFQRLIGGGSGMSSGGGAQFGTGGDWGAGGSDFSGFGSGGTDLLSGGYGPDPYMDLTSLFQP